MKPLDFNTFTSDLVDTLTYDDRVIGLAGLGSFAMIDYQPDQWSDHDFFLIVKPGTQEQFRSDLSWLPNHHDIVLSYRETDHGLKVLYRYPHLIEFAVFDREELNLARINRYRIYLEKEPLANAFRALREKSTRETQHTRDDLFHLGQFLTILYVGVGRFRRGEELSGHLFVKTSSLYHLVPLLKKYIQADNTSLLDNLDPFRRFDMVYPKVARELQLALEKPVPDCAIELLGIAHQYLSEQIEDYPIKAVNVVREFLNQPPVTLDDESTADQM